MTMIYERLLITSKKKIPLPGPQTLVSGNATTGYYGEVVPGDLMSGTTLADTIGLTTRTNYFPNANWLKFSYNGKVLFIAKQPFFSGVTWSSVYLIGAVYGNNTTGTTPPSVTPTIQNRQVVINGVTYRVRLIRGVNVDPYSTNTYNVDNAPNTQDSEWDRLILNMTNGTLGSLTVTDLGINTSTNLGTSAAFSTSCQESHPLGAQFRLTRGYTTITKLGAANVTTTLGWRPVLEPIT